MSVRATLFNCGLAMAGLCERASHAFLYAVVGLLRLNDLRDMSCRSWHALAVDDRIFSGLNGWEEAAYRPFVNAGDRLCIVGCSAGRDLLSFVDAGHEVVGIEPSPELAGILRGILREKKGARAEVVEGFIEDVALPGTFDVVVFSYLCYSYIPGSSARVGALRKCAGHLNPKGRILISYLPRTGAWDSRSIRLAALVLRLTRSDWRLEPHDSIVRTANRAVLYEHSFAPEEVEREAEAAGLQVRHHTRYPISTPFVVLGPGGTART